MAVTMGSQLVFLSIFVTLTIGAPEYHLKDFQPRDIDGNVITYYFYSQSNLEEGIAIKSEKIHEISNTFDSDKETFFFVHGWLDRYTSLSATLVRRAILEAYDVNMVVVDWGEVADSINYFYAKDGVQSVGKFFGDFINDLSTTYNLSLSKISIAGHSLGAHIAGVAGKSLNGEIDHITGLDPAAPFIDGSDESYTLNKGDAKFVQVIHTSGGKLGIGQAIGHADYYPNGGSDQSGCILDLAGSCAHQRSFEYFAESIKNGTFLAERCLNFVEYYSGACNGEKSLMGGYYVDKRASGNYYLKTNDQSPFAMTEVE